MKKIKRDVYLQKLINKRDNGLIKVITGIRRCGKSYLLDPLFKDYLIKSGVKENHIIKLELDRLENEKYHDPYKLNDYIKSKIKDNDKYYKYINEKLELLMHSNDIDYLNLFYVLNKNEDYLTKGNNIYITNEGNIAIFNKLYRKIDQLYLHKQR